ncbi:uncharacterized protein LOC144135241 [Amblyomma americanum]
MAVPNFVADAEQQGQKEEECHNEHESEENDKEQVDAQEQQQRRAKPLRDRIFQVFATVAFSACCVLAAYAGERARLAFDDLSPLLLWTWLCSPMVLAAAIGALKLYRSANIAAQLQHQVAAAG